jgi:prophage regulatory protein
VQQVSENSPPVKRDRLLRLPEVEGLTGLKKSSIYGLVKAGKFVRPVRISARCVAWPEQACLQWVQDQIAARGDQA